MSSFNISGIVSTALLSTITFAGVLSHLSFDTFAGSDGRFPLFTPFYNHQIIFPSIDWVYFEIAAVAVAGTVAILVARQSRKVQASA